MGMNKDRRWAPASLPTVLIAVLLVACGSAPSPSSSSDGPHPSASASPSASPSATPAAQAVSALNPPTSRGAFAAGYDPATRTVVIEGGFPAAPTAASAVTTETWSWDGLRWTRLADGPAVGNASLTPDPVSGHLLLVGGDDPRPGQVVISQTGMWSWNGSSWSHVADNPAEGGVSQAATDPVHKQVLISATGPTGACPPGECPQTPAPYQQYGHYVWDGTRWAAAATDFSDYYGSTDAAMGFDPISSRVIQQGGSSQATFDTTLAWNGTAWSVLHADTGGAEPTGPLFGTAATDGSALMMLGDPKTGNRSIASTWTFDGAGWQRHVITEPAAESRLVFDAALGVFVAIGAAPNQRALSVWVLRSLSDGWQLLPS